MEEIIQLGMNYMYKKKTIGKFGENLACKYLEKKEYNIVERNFSCMQGEIDIIAYDLRKKELVFFEVKTRTNFNYGFPSDAVNRQKQRHILNSVKYYLYSRNIQNTYIRIDVIEIVVNKGNYKLNHLEKVF